MSSPFNVSRPHGSDCPEETFRHALRLAIARGRHHLLLQQSEQGCWNDPPPHSAEWESETLLVEVFLGRSDSRLARSCAARLESMQHADGHWSTASGKGSDLDATLKGYFAMKLAGHHAGESAMQRVRKWILNSGGADRSGARTRLFFAALGQIPYDCLRAMVPGRNRDFDLNSSSGRVTRLVMNAFLLYRPVAAVPSECGIRELFLESPRHWSSPRRKGSVFSRTWTFSLRRKRRLAERFTAECLAGELSIETLLLAKMAAGMLDLDDEHPALTALERNFRECLEPTDSRPEEILPIDRRPEAIRLMSSSTPYRRTSEVVRALRESGSRTTCDQIAEARDWLLAQATGEAFASNTVLGQNFRRRWNRKKNASPPRLRWIHAIMTGLSPEVESGEGDLLPADVRFLHHRRCADRPSACREAGDISAKFDLRQRCGEELKRQQRRDGSWSSIGSWEKDVDDDDRIAATCEALEALLWSGAPLKTPEVRRAVAFLKRSQRADGSWSSENVVARTGQVLMALQSAGLSPDDTAMAAGANRLLSCQLESGGWAEREPADGDSNASLPSTSLAVLGLLAAGRELNSAVARGVSYLMDRQSDDGSWSGESGVSPESRETETYSSLTVSSLVLRALARFARTRRRRRSEEAATSILQMTAIRIHAPTESAESPPIPLCRFHEEPPRWVPRLFRGE